MFKPSHKKKSSINIIPLIDVIFFLLVFFMLFTSFRANPHGLEMQLPQAVTATEQDENNFIVYISQDEEHYLNDEQISIEQMRNTLQQEVNENPQLVVIINPDRRVRYEAIILVMDNLRQIGINNIFLGAERENTEN